MLVIAIPSTKGGPVDSSQDVFAATPTFARAALWPPFLGTAHISCVASTMCSSSKNVIIPTPPHPQLRSIHHVFKFKECHHAQPTPPHPQLRSIHHVFKFKECHHAHPTPPHPSSCVASTMCSSSKNVIMATPPQQLRSIHHVFKFKECHHAHPTPPHPQLRSIHHVFKFKESHHPHPTPPQQLRSIQHVFKSKECHHGRTWGLARTCWYQTPCFSLSNYVLNKQPCIFNQIAQGEEKKHVRIFC